MSKNANKIALVTGSSRGLGRNMVEHLARRGVGVVITYRSNKAEAEAVAAEARAAGVRAAVLQFDAGDSASFAGFGEQVRSTLQEEWQRDSFDYLV
ncbi:MAG: SDR family NAD(P)-dependent oxidoreductase, partial [Rhodocyclaceae bacterium]|nr:SDR family NAD(P)-dependent oxidoreductase [Rhodocyclaceae bacterium]